MKTKKNRKKSIQSFRYNFRNLGSKKHFLNGNFSVNLKFYQEKNSKCNKWTKLRAMQYVLQAT